MGLLEVSIYIITDTCLKKGLIAVEQVLYCGAQDVSSVPLS